MYIQLSQVLTIIGDQDHGLNYSELRHLISFLRASTKDDEFRGGTSRLEDGLGGVPALKE
jgi:hypothetical protein